MKIFTAPQIKALDRKTITEQNLQSIELMERAAETFTHWFVRYYDRRPSVQVFAGVGDNGGDGLAIARLLFERDYPVQVYVILFSNNLSKDFKTNLERLRYRGIEVIEVSPGSKLHDLDPEAVAIDAILGSGLSRPIEGWLAKIIEQINQTIPTIISVDIASGLFADQHTRSTGICPKQTFCFESPKLAFFFSENYEKVGRWFVGSIESSEKGIAEITTPYHYVTKEMIREIYRPRSKFSHKGTHGRALFIVGSKGMMGAGLLAAKAALRSGVGLVTAHVPNCGYSVAQTALPELVVSIDKNENTLSEIPDLSRYHAVGIGCGLGESPETQTAIEAFFETVTCATVVDASALNVVSQRQWHHKLPKNCIITPHAGEFIRLFGETSNDFERNELQRTKAKELGIYIILKGAHTAIACPDGSCFFNSTGNPGMATGGTGDVLTGILTSLLSQGYSPKDAAILGVYLHGLAGDIAAEQQGYEALIASDIVEQLGKAFAKIH